MGTILKKSFIICLLCLCATYFFINELIDYYNKDLPSIDEIVDYKPKTISRVFDRNNLLLGSFYNEKRDFVPIQKIPELVRFAFISAEDKNFYRHSGYDPLGLFKAIIGFSMGQKLRGASTITQQVTKGLLLSGERSVERKFKELILAIQLEKALSKDAILEIYLNEVYLGEKAYGVSAAAYTYFSKDLSELLPREAAFLAALPKSPEAYNPKYNKDYATKRRNFVLTEMVENGYMDASDLNLEQNSILETVQTGEISGKNTIKLFQGFLAEDIKTQVMGQLGYRFFSQGGFSIKTTIDQSLQDVAKNALKLEIESLARVQNSFLFPNSSLNINPDINKIDWTKSFNKMGIGVSTSGLDIAVVLRIENGTTWIGTTKSSKEEKLHFFEQTVPNLKVGNIIQVKEITGEGNSLPKWYYNQGASLDGGVVISDLKTGQVLALEGGYRYNFDSLNHITEAKKNRLDFLKPILIASSLRKLISEEINIGNKLLDKNTENYRKNLSEFLLNNTNSEKVNKLLKFINEPMNANISIDRDQLDESITEHLISGNIIKKSFSSPDSIIIQSDLTMLSILSAYAHIFKTTSDKDSLTLLLNISKDGKTVFSTMPESKSCESCELSKENEFMLMENIIIKQSYSNYHDINFDLLQLDYFVSQNEAVKRQNGAFFGKHHFNEELAFDSMIGITTDKILGCHIEQRLPNVYHKPLTLSGACLSLIQRILGQD